MVASLSTVLDTQTSPGWLLACRHARAGQRAAVEYRLKLLLDLRGQAARIGFVGDDVRGHQHDQLGPARAIGVAPEQRADPRQIVEERYPLRLAAVGLLDHPAEQDRLAALDADPAVQPALLEGRRIDLRCRGR